MSSKLLTEHQQNLAEIREKSLNMIRILSEGEGHDEMLKNKGNINGFIKICCMLIKLIPVEYQTNRNLNIAAQDRDKLEDISEEDIIIITNFLQEIYAKKELKNE